MHSTKSKSCARFSAVLAAASAVQAYREVPTSQRRKRFRQRVTPGKATLSPQPLSQNPDLRRRPLRPMNPNQPHCESRSARIAAATTFRSGFIGNIRNPSFVRIGVSNGTFFSTSSTMRMLPSGGFWASKAVPGRNNSALVILPLSSATSFIWANPTFFHRLQPFPLLKIIDKRFA
jgi:hypothetical protein